ncbi:iron complex transport system ATP-binding protein [Austwickia chelonae]|uniref:Putative ABC transporter ATP-binding protein n=1 Tax=Austwickia chelonae NBRC 105200 TaxID=1184607 RepID=K6VNI5_9MICO|nr:ABC transporter ATP-binding protein [Austwickia chelonae]GAB78299.1 putative ABC transporter ATP-binding protein [Austwickia chelonae NBRC 105200]SEW00749.1 iron complex transport system ATP-binding protein [Austwickia chelonae]
MNTDAQVAAAPSRPAEAPGTTAPSRTDPTTGIHLHQVGFRVGQAQLLDGVDLHIPRQGRTAVVGTNGAGKSTLLKILAGLRPPTSGEVRLDGVDLRAMSSAARARQIAFVGQEDVPAADLCVGEAVSLGRTPHRRPWQGGGAGERRLVTEALEAVGMSHRIDDPCDRLSGGERRRLVLARGLVQKAGILVLDEPTNHLDIAWQLRLWHLLADLPGAVVAAVHDIDIVLRHFDAVVVLAAGRVVAAGNPQDALTPEVVAEAFGVRAHTLYDPHTQGLRLLIDDVLTRSTASTSLDASGKES